VSLEALVGSYGYLALLVGTFLEGETILVLGGVAAKLGYLELPWVIACAFAGTFCGDQLFFFLGRYKGAAILERRPAWQGPVERVHDKLVRHQVAVILGFRFLYGLRNVTPFVIGMSPIATSRFFVLNLLGASIWAGIIGCLGFLFGHGLEVVLGDIRKYEMVVMLAVVVAGAGLWLFHVLRRRRC
jgi:membrane protein DedA with SNARE-associated domain